MIHVVPFYPIPVPPKEDFFKLGLDLTGGELVSVKGKSSLSVLMKIWGKDVHAHGRGFPFPEACGWVARKSIYTPHNDTIGSNPLTRFVRRLLFNTYDYIVAQTEYNKEQLVRDGVKEAKILVMPTPVDYTFFASGTKKEGESFRKKHGIKKNEKVAVAVGIRPLKNPLVIAEACERAGFKAVMLGATREEELAKAWGRK
ncbi:MAG: glycosyltransferase, partial [Candidatus Diapherotrites archaeon]|nr:glycosyltransferase [Candidatus Diapherotrites archaeon]